MELLAMGLVDSHFGLFGDSVSVVQDRCTLCTESTIGSEYHFGCTRWYS
jgi:hypothetical protein